MRKLALAASILAAASVAYLAPAASASPPVITPVTITVTITITDLCRFPLSLSSVLTGTEIDYYDASGALVRSYLHLTEQDTFSANGITGVGSPYTFNVDFVFVNGVPVSIFAEGVAEKITLLSGTFFLTAGRVDFIAHNDGFVLVPDHGTPANVAAFCAAFTK